METKKIEFNNKTVGEKGVITIQGEMKEDDLTEWFEGEVKVEYPEKNVSFHIACVPKHFQEVDGGKGIQVGENEHGQIVHAMNDEAREKYDDALEDLGVHCPRRVDRSFSGKDGMSLENQARESILGGEVPTEGEFRNNDDWKDETPMRPEGGTYQ